MGFLAGWVETEKDVLSDAQLCNQTLTKLCGNAPTPVRTIVNDFIACAVPISQLFAVDNFLYAISDLNAGQQMRLEENLSRFRQAGERYLPSILIKGALMMVDIVNRQLILATDPIGQTNLYYALTKRGLVFGTSADIVIRHPAVASDISLQSIYDYVYFHHCPSPNTIYKQVHKLEGGQILTYQDGRISVRHYWIPEFSEASVSLENSGQELKHLIRQVVEDSSLAVDNTGAFLSGGLDSSTVAGALSEVFPEHAKTFSIGFPAEGYDEIEYARIASTHFRTRAHEYYVTPDDTVAAVPKIAAYYDEPFGNSSALAAYYCAKLAKENGIDRLLAGDGGDELFAGNERYAKQLLFERYYRIPSLLKSPLKAGLYHMPDFLLRNKILFKAKRYVEQAEVPLPDRLQDYNYLNRHLAGEIFRDDFVEQIDTDLPIQGLRECYHRPQSASSLNRMLYMDWKTTLHDNDLVKVNRMCELAGVEVQYPLLNYRIVDFSCKIPSDDKLRGQHLRWFYKKAMTNFLPEAIINKSKHGFGLPFGVWLQDHQPLKDLAYASVEALKKRTYFRNGFLDHAIKMHQSIHAAYYGELIWILMMLELWFQAKNIK